MVGLATSLSPDKKLMGAVKAFNNRRVFDFCNEQTDAEAICCLAGRHNKSAAFCTQTSASLSDVFTAAHPG